MAKALVGGVSPEGKRLIQSYLDYFVPNAEIVDLRAVGIKSRVKLLGRRSDTILVILDEYLYSMCVGVADEVLADTKTHEYIDDTGLKQFLVSKFGELPYFEENKMELMSNSESSLCTKEEKEAVIYDSFQVVIDFANSLFYVDPSWKMDEERAEMIRQFDEHMKEVNTHPANLNFDTEEGMKHDRPHVEVTEEEIRAFEEAGQL